MFVLCFLYSVTGSIGSRGDTFQTTSLQLSCPSLGNPCLSDVMTVPGRCEGPILLVVKTRASLICPHRSSIQGHKKTVAEQVPWKINVHVPSYGWPMFACLVCAAGQMRLAHVTENHRKPTESIEHLRTNVRETIQTLGLCLFDFPGVLDRFCLFDLISKCLKLWKWFGMLKWF